MDKHLRMRYKARDYGSRDSGLSLFFFARRATRSGEESGFPEFGATWVPSYRTSAARDPRSITTSAPGRRGATRYMLRVAVELWGRVDGVLRAG